MPHDPHQEFRELCALSTTGELTEAEWARLGEHLADCDACLELLQEYELVVGRAVPASAARSQPESYCEEAPGDWSIEGAEARLMLALENEPRSTSPNPMAGRKRSRRWGAKALASAAVLVGAFTLAGYELGRSHFGRSHFSLPDTTTSNSSPSPGTPPAIASATLGAELASEHDAQSTTLRRQTGQQEEKIARLEEQLKERNEQLAREEADLKQSQDDRAQLNRALEQAEATAEALQAKMSVATDQSSQEALDLLVLRTKIGDLTADLADKDRQIAHEQELLQHDRDIRNLIGARDLYIAEIYDVAKSGATQKPFGRVFYTKDKSLIFYGYDLDQQKGISKDASFQAWGRRDSDQKHDINLGLLYQDDSDRKRWALKCNDRRTVSELDAVFITVEPKGGSAKPSGKPLLFTFLRLDPNHP